MVGQRASAGQNATPPSYPKPTGNYGPQTRANREKDGTPMPIWRDGGVDGWIVFGGPARAGPGGGGGGRDARGGGAAVRGRALDRPPLGARSEERRVGKERSGGTPAYQ